MNLENSPSVNKPTQLKNIDTVKPPLVEIASDQDFAKFVNTGITVKIALPLAKNSENFLFGINLDGLLINFWNIMDPLYGVLLANLFPVQINPDLIGKAEIIWTPIPYPIYSAMQSNRFMSGNVRIGLRITSNVGQTGNLYITEVNSVTRSFYENTKTDLFKGVRFNNISDRTVDFGNAGFITGDVSLNRNIAITPSGANNNRVLDIQLKMARTSTIPTRDVNTFHKIGAIMTQFAEDWLLVSGLTNFPSTQGNEMFITVFADYSNISFFGKTMPMLATVPCERFTQIMLVSKSIDGKAPLDVKKAAIKWLPLAN